MLRSDSFFFFSTKHFSFMVGEYMHVEPTDIKGQLYFIVLKQELTPVGP